MSEANVQKNGKRKLRPNIIDLLIVVAVIGAVIGIALRAGVVEKVVNNINVEPARITFMVYDINNDSFDYFNAGDAFFSDTHGYLGTLEAKPLEMAAEAYIAGIDGTLIKTQSPGDLYDPTKNGRIDVKGSILASGFFSEDGFLLGGTNYIAPGSKVKMNSKNISVTATVINIEPINAAE